MRSFYGACDLSAERGRVMLGCLHQDKLTLSEVRRFANEPIRENGSLHWNIPQLYQEIIAGLHDIGTYEEAVESISCSSWPCDYLLFEADGSLITPTYHQDTRSTEAMQRVLSKLSAEALYAETGLQPSSATTLCQLAAEKSRRLGRAASLLPVADAFNYLLAGVPRAETSLAAATQLYNPVTGTWSTRLLNAFGLPPRLFPPLVSPGTVLGTLREEIGQKSSLEETRVIASCSREIAAALAALPIENDETWAFLRCGSLAVMGTELQGPLINEMSRQHAFSNECGYAGAIRFSKQTAGLWILEECRRYWKEKDREIDDALLTHLAGSAPPFEALIDLDDPRFSTPGDMPLKIQAVCRETSQLVPRKPGPIIRCILESLALHYRKTLREIEELTGARITRLYLLDGNSNELLSHFIANAMHCSVLLAPPDLTSIGNVIIQAVALGQIKSHQQARELVRNSFKLETLMTHPAAWDTAWNRLGHLFRSR